MIKCIFTNIKNEHQYLEQWIAYHIKLGFNKFILYEDEGSISHSEIIMKYKDVVDIDFYDYILRKDDNTFKDTKCLQHILENYNDIDWIIKLDPDEYISFADKHNTIDDLLYNINPNVNQLFLYWRLYNANGLIECPSHDKYSLIDTYISYVPHKNLATYFDQNTSNVLYETGKSLFRYSSIEDRTAFNISVSLPHYISDTEPTKNYNPDYLCINHYITKSFDEYYHRLKDKGEYNATNYRKLGDFFVLNPDMIGKIPEIESKYGIDIFSFKTKLNTNSHDN